MKDFISGLILTLGMIWLLMAILPILEAAVMHYPVPTYCVILISAVELLCFIKKKMEGR